MELNSSGKENKALTDTSPRGLRTSLGGRRIAWFSIPASFNLSNFVVFSCSCFCSACVSLMPANMYGVDTIIFPFPSGFILSSLLGFTFRCIVDEETINLLAKRPFSLWEMGKSLCLRGLRFALLIWSWIHASPSYIDA
jgi:hypothetical protein